METTGYDRLDLGKMQKANSLAISNLRLLYLSLNNAAEFERAVLAVLEDAKAGFSRLSLIANSSIDAQSSDWR